jgi:hypothetical protein
MLSAAGMDKDIFSSLIIGAGAMDEKPTGGALQAIIEAPDTSAFEGVDGGETVVHNVRGLLKNPTEEELQDYRKAGLFATNRRCPSCQPVGSAAASAWWR